MKKVMVGNHVLEFEKDFVEKFETTVLDSFERSAEKYLLSNYNVPSLEDVFTHHSLGEIAEVITMMASMEIRNYGDFFLDKAKE